ncbi:PREDICTED: uncharacterized protein LOC108754997 [Trachymyrmex septentrionalis]|uniref:uncharacterized protein LOC108754997 n=1 Tax=Trachymyrmex septentrionalis TaxID=34720 RepID=UPI00084F3D78|nr:PREDICTED: uncharacterized protein LOC108754997 [Trachymyrmex septentrionalis]
MKRSLTLFILALIAIVIANDDNKTVEDIAKMFNIDVPKVQTCVDEEGIKIEQLRTWLETFNRNGTVEENEDANGELKQTCSFIACLLEKKRMMEDEKLIVDKIIESIKEEDRNNNMSEEILTNWKNCMNSLNENSQLTREDRACGILYCVSSQ